MDSNIIIDNFWQLITADMYIVVAAIYGICFALKRAKFFDDRFIPIAALVIGILFEVLLAAAFTRIGIVNAVLKGIVCGMASVFVANIVKQIKVGKGENDVESSN